MRRIILGISIIILMGAGFVLFGKTETGDTEQESPMVEQEPQDIGVVMSIKNTQIQVDVADTKEKRAQGLSGRAALPIGTGLLFVFDQSDHHGFWMKDMNFPIDIIWFDEGKKIVYVKEHATPESFPEIFRPERQALYVLEVNAGFVVQHNVRIGDQALWLL